MLGPRKTKWSVKILLAIFLTVQFGVLFPRPAHAQFIVHDLIDFTQRNLKETTDTIENSIAGALLIAAAQSVSFFVNKIAYDAATYIASAGSGQKPLVYDKGFGKYLEGVAGDTLADGIGELGKPFGLNLCQFPDLNLQVFLQIGLRSLYGQGPPQPNCTFQQLRDGWNPEKFAAKYGGNVGKYLGEKFSASISVQQSDFGIALGALGKIDALKVAATAAADSERLEGLGVKPLTDAISGKIKTPAALIKEDLAHLSPSERAELTAGQYWDLVVNTDNLIQLAGSAAGTFLNTLASQLLKRFLTKGFLPEGSDRYDPSFFGVVTENRRAAQQAFSFLLTPTIPESGTISIVGEFAACPPQPGLNNCVINTELQAAIDRARTQKPLTIRDAMKEGLLHGNWPIVSPRNEVENTSKECFRTKYCYSNIQKLRKARIMPLGFEIAALKADPADPPTLQQVVDGFDRCAPDGRPNPLFPWCHLINPNWVIKAPEIISAKLVGPELADPTSAGRREEYMDFSTCVPDAEGNCSKNYGYCTQEKNVWRLGGDKCEPQYNTCKTYATETRQRVSYLSRTLDFGECTEDTVGCRVYSAVETAPGVWQASVDASLDRNTKAFGRNEAIFLNGGIIGKTCSPDAEGCTEFIAAAREREADGNYTYTKVANAKIFAKKAPEYLGCYDANPDPIQVDWPQTVTEIQNNIPANPACDKFASVCVEGEVGCEAYTPTRNASAAAIPGIIGGNACEAQCVGYDTFRKEATNFEPSAFPLYFIPSEGRSCQPEYAGCDEFTNLDAAALGGEGLEYYTAIKYCEKPDGTNERVFYSWEGSFVDGFVLRVHRLLQIDEEDITYLGAIESSAGGVLDLPGKTSGEVFPLGSPAYDVMGRASLETYYGRCNNDKYALTITDPINPNRADPDCRALYDENGQIYYRLLAHTVTVSEACHPLRKTASELYADADIPNDLVCASVGGVWETNQCRRCYQGGRYQNGSCVYQTISLPGEGSACPASANGCRAYVGNTGNNREIVFDDGFEPVGTGASAAVDARENWDSVPAGSNEVRVASEALQVSGHSLFVNVDSVSRDIVTTSLQVGRLYEVSFWARSVAAENLDIAFVQESGDRNAFPRVSIGSAWQEYRLGPVELKGDLTGEDAVMLVFTRSASQPGGQTAEYFLDYVRLTALQDTAYLVKDSWKTAEEYDVPLACDATPEDSFPGAALGCTEYKDSAGDIAYAAGFEQLCREKAVGCRPLYDTYNTTAGPNAGLMQIFNLWCEQRQGSVRIEGNRCFYDIIDTGGNVTGQTPSCTIPVGGSGCYIPKVEYPYTFANLTSHIYGGAFRPSTIVIPADTPEDAPVFLATRQEFLCRDRDKGCQKLGLEEKILPQDDASAYRHATAYLLNDPDAYVGIDGAHGTLCREEVVGCGEFTSNNSTAYFRDPSVTGAGTCSYRTNVEIARITYSGWFRDGVDSVPCYGAFLRRTASGLVYDIHSNRDLAYEGRVGQCPSEANACTELVDPADKSELYPNGKPYYALFNNKITEKISACDGRVSLTEGCVLMDLTENPNKLYSTALTYARSEEAVPPFSLVAPASAPSAANNDANIIISVDRDRVCGEWLACQSSIIERDNKSGRPKQLCYEYKACDATAPGKQCTSWVPEGSAPFARLTEAAYIRRDTSWQGTEYSGYSLFNKYQITDMSYAQFDLRAEEYSSLRQAGFGDVQYAVFLFRSSANDCVAVGRNTNWQACGPSDGGRCYGQRCLLPIDGPFGPDMPRAPRPPAPEEQISADDLELLLLALNGGTCKAFPERTSPFPISLVPEENRNPLPSAIDPIRSDFGARKPGFEQANVCQNGTCACLYQKAVYKGGEVDYWSFPVVSQIPQGICSGGRADGRPCSENQTCGGSESICNFQQKKETHAGLFGFCLERDFSRPINGLANFAKGERQDYACLTWLPIDVSASNLDFYNTFIEAGYQPELDANPDPQNENGPIWGRSYCLAATKLGDKVDGSQSQGLLETTVNSWDIAHFGSVSPYFRANGEASIPGNSTCGDNSPYITRMCIRQDTRPDVPPVYETMQTWAWRKLGPHAVVLRVEKSHPPSDATVGKYSGLQFLDDRDDRGRLNFGLFEMIQRYGAQETVMHPPRTWGDTDSGRRQALMRESYSLTSGDRRMEGYPLAPYPEFENDAILIHPTLGAYNPFNTVLVRLPSENVIREGDIRRVYLVPKSFHSSSGDNPLLLTDQMYIDFPLLNSAPGQSNRREDIEISYENGTDFFQFPDPQAYRGSTDPNVRGTTSGIVWTYIDDQLPSYSEYPGSGSALDYYASDHRNSIAKRYVLVWTRNNADAALIVPPSDQPEARRDVFGGPCASSGNGWFAIGMDFNADGEFLGYISRACRMDRVALAVIATINDMCTQFAEIHTDEISFKDSNKAWTDRVWQYASDGASDNPMPLNHPLGAYSGLRRDKDNLPFGSLRLLASDVPSAIGQIAQSVLQKLRNYTFRYSDTTESVPADGVPYSCVEEQWRGLDTIFSSNACSSDTSASSAVSNKSFNTAKNGLAQLFAKTYFIASTENGSVVEGEDRSETIAGADLQPPQIYSLNPARCYGTAFRGEDPNVPLTKPCTAGEANNMTVNVSGVGYNFTLTNYDGELGADEDADGNGVVDPIIGIGQLPITLEFFAFADDNRMPIRRVMVDWGQRGDPRNTTGFYKNRKPFCSPNEDFERTIGLCGSDEDNLTGITCKEDIDCPWDATGENQLLCFGALEIRRGPVVIVPSRPSEQYQFAHFGNAPRACSSGRFQFTYNYNCSLREINALARQQVIPAWIKTVREVKQTDSDFYNTDAYARLKFNHQLEDDDPICVFRPRVQVTDNWGWCNAFTNPAGFWNGSPFFSCDTDSNAYTPYRGFVIVVPS